MPHIRKKSAVYTAAGALVVLALILVLAANPKKRKNWKRSFESVFKECDWYWWKKVMEEDAEEE